MPLQDKARELYRRACELSQSAGRVGKPSRLGNVHIVNRPYGPAGHHSQMDPSKARSIRNNALRRNPSEDREASAGDADSVLWQASSTSDRAHSPSMLWRLVKGVEVGSPGWLFHEGTKAVTHGLLTVPTSVSFLMFCLV